MYWTTATLLRLILFTLCLQQPSGAVLTETVWPAKPTTFTIWPLTEQVCQCLMSSINSLIIYYVPNTLEKKIVKAKFLSSGGSKSCEKNSSRIRDRKRGRSMIRVMRGHLSERKPFEQGTEVKERGRESCAGEGEEASRPRKWHVQGPHVRIRSACLKKSK